MPKNEKGEGFAQWLEEEMKVVRRDHPTVRIEKLEQEVAARFKEIDLSIRMLQNALLDATSRAERSVRLVQEFGQRLAKLELAQEQ